MKNKNVDFILNPAKYVAGMQGVYAAIAVCIILSLVGFYQNIRFDGLLDMHLVEENASFYHSLLENLIDWAALSLIFYGIALAFKSKIRFIDAIGILAVPRIIMLFSIIFTRLLKNVIDINPNESIGELQSKLLSLGSTDYFLIIISAIALILLLILMIAILFNCCKTISNLKGSTLIISFTLSIILAEICSKWLISIID